MERYGYIKSPKDNRDFKINKKVNRVVILPSEFSLDHPKIKDQGNVNSCVAFALSSVLEYTGKENYSTGWIYGYRPSSYYQGEGMITAEALKTVKNIGYLKNEELDVNIEMDAAKEIVDKNLSIYKSEAKARQIKSYARLDNIQEIKQAIYSTNSPVLVAIEVGPNGIELDSNYIAYIPSKYTGGHQMFCYGWNEFGLYIQNSWSESWGNKGTFILPYEYPISEAWLVQFTTNEESDKIIKKPLMYYIRKVIKKIVDFILRRN